MRHYIMTASQYDCRVAVTPPGMAREDWKILRALSEVSIYLHMYMYMYIQ